MINIYGMDGIKSHNSYNDGIHTLLPQSATPGSVWVDGSGLHVYSGSSWQRINTHATVGLDSEITEVIRWAKEKMLAEQRENELLEKYPALAIAKQNYETIKDLVKDIQ